MKSLNDTLQGLDRLNHEDILSTQDPTSHPRTTFKKREERMKLLQGCKFALRDAKNFDQLTTRLIEYIDSLYKICSESDCKVSTIASDYS